MNMIRIHILGAGGAVPTPTHTPAAYWLTLDGQSFLLDPGPGALVRLVKSGEIPNGLDDIDRVLLTHLHPDHSADLIALLFALHSPVPVSAAPITITGPKGLVQLVDQLKGIYGRWLEPRQRELIIREIEPGTVMEQPGGGKITSFAVNHGQDRLSQQPLGYRFTDARGQLLVFSGDTGPCTELEEAATGADLLLVECSTPDELATAGHLAPKDVGQVCCAAQPKQVVLTHQYPDSARLDLVAEVGQYWTGNIHQAVDGSIFSIGTDGEKEN